MEGAKSSRALIPCFVVVLLAVLVMIVVLGFSSSIFPQKVDIVRETILQLQEDISSYPKN